LDPLTKAKVRHSGRRRQNAGSHPSETMRLAPANRRKVLLNLTSLIDVLFILIIFFAVSSTFLEQPGIELKLPEAETSEAHPAQKAVIYVDSEGHVFLNDDPTDLAGLAERVKPLVAEQTEKSVILRADSQARHGTVISIMDLLRKEGIFKIVISTEKPSPEAAGP
jgi:biopolymer transport protein ExbD